MLRAGAGKTPGMYLAPVSNKAAEGIRVFIIDLEFLGAEFANFFLKENFSFTPAKTFLALAVVRIRASVASLLAGTALAFIGSIVKHYNFSSKSKIRAAFPKLKSWKAALKFALLRGLKPENRKNHKSPD
jgi:hypothetical protein